MTASIWGLLTGLVAGLAVPCAAIPADRGWIVGTDDRRVVEEHGGPWDAIGQINVTYSKWMFRCTGVLVAPNVVLTAAHCLFNPFTKKAFNADQIHFTIGVHGAANKGHAVGKCMHLADGYEYLHEATRRSPALPRLAPEQAFSSDLAALVLRHPLTPSPVSLATNLELPLHTALWHAGYVRERRQDLTGHLECRLRRVDRALNIWLTDCDSSPGADGGPVFVREDGELRVAAILVTGAVDNQFTIAVPLTAARGIGGKSDCPTERKSSRDR